GSQPGGYTACTRGEREQVAQPSPFIIGAQSFHRAFAVGSPVQPFYEFLALPVNHSCLYSGVCRQGDHVCLGTVSQEGPMTGATGGSMPVGSGRLLVQLF